MHLTKQNNMVNLSVRQGMVAIREAKKQLGKDKLASAMSVGINKTVRDTKRIAVTAITNHYYIPKKYLNALGSEISTPATLEAFIFASKSPIPMEDFEKSHSKNSGVTIRIKKGSSSNLRGAFMISGKNDVIARGRYRMRRPFGFMWKRKSNKEDRSDLTSMVTLSVSGALSNKNVQKEINTYVRMRLPKNVSGEIEKRLSRLKSIK